MSLAAEYHEILETLPPDWSDLYFELELPDEQRLDEARLMMAQAQLERIPGYRTRFSFRVSNTRGYGCYAPLAESCLAKLDTRLIGGYLSLERVLTAVEPNMTQGPVIGR
jgi:hypothetical protein